jgi:NADPH2:quinone reductase
MLVPVPDGLDLEMAACLMLQGMTVHYLTHSTFPLAAGHTCLVHAASGGVGLLLVQVAKMLGATVIGTVSTDLKEKLARDAGADHVLRYDGFSAKVKELTSGKGVDVVYDSVGKDTFDGSLDSLKPRGMMVTFGNASGPVPPVAPLALTQRGSLFLTRPKLADYTLTREELLLRAGDVMRWKLDGRINVHIDRRYPLADAASAHRDLASRKTSGKLIISTT